MFPSRYLSKDDVPTPAVVTIKSVTQEEIKGERGNELKNVVLFSGNTKPLILNKGNALTLAEAYGDDSAAWIGKPVEVYTDPSVAFGGKRVGGLRLRIPSRPSNGQHTDVYPETSVGWSWPTAQAEALKAGISRDELVAELKAAGLAGWNPKHTAAAQKIIAARLQPAQGDAFDEFGEPPTDGGFDIPF